MRFGAKVKSTVLSWSPPTTLSLTCALLMLANSVLGLRWLSLGDFRSPQIAVAAVIALWWWRLPRRWAEPVAPWARRAFQGASLAYLVAASSTALLSFRAGGVDLSIFEWMLGSTLNGRFGYSRIYDVNHFGVHSTFLLLALVPAYAVVHSTLLLTTMGALLTWASLFPLRRLVRWAAPAGHGGLECVAALACVTNPWCGRMTREGFRIEQLLPLLSLWFLVGWAEKRPRVWAAALVGLFFSKEDATLFLGAFAVGAVIVERARWREAGAVLALSLAWLLTYTRCLQPALLGHPPAYLSFWGGASLGEIAWGWLCHPLEVMGRLATSGWWHLLLPALLVPLRSLRATAAMAPTLFLLGVSNYGHMRAFGGYYAVPLVAFALFGFLDVWRAPQTVSSPWRRAWVVAGLIAFPLFFDGYARVVPVNFERLASMAMVRAEVASAGRICVAPVLFPHFGVDDRLSPLFDLRECEDDPLTTIVVNAALDPKPHESGTYVAWVSELRAKRPARDYPGGFTVFGPLTGKAADPASDRTGETVDAGR